MSDDKVLSAAGTSMISSIVYMMNSKEFSENFASIALQISEIDTTLNDEYETKSTTEEKYALKNEYNDKYALKKKMIQQ